MGLETWLLFIALGAVCGMLGQGIRVIVGLYKGGVFSTTESFDFTRFALSIFIGAVAGGIAVLTLTTVGAPILGGQQIATLIAAGYAGTDFIEGFISKVNK